MIVVLGSGAVGAYVGGMLAASGAPVTFVGRTGPPVAMAGGLTLTPLGGAARLVPKPRLRGHSALSEASIVIVAVKSRDTNRAANQIALYAPDDALVVSLQNGLGNPDLLRRGIEGRRIVPGVVGFNLVNDGKGNCRQTTGGGIVLGTGAEPLAERLQTAGIETHTSENMEGVQWSKLILNLNNALNALSGLPLREQLLDRGWRRLLADSGAEALAVAHAGGVTLERVGRINPQILPYALRLPTPLFRRAAKALLRIDPRARSSMADDLAAGRPSEVRWLQGRVVEEAEALGLSAPINRIVAEMTEAVFARRCPAPSVADLRAAIARGRV